MRVLLLWLIAGALALLAGCRAEPEDGTRLRLGYMLRLTHAPALTGLETGRLGRALSPATLDARAFEVGNAVVEALFAGELDAALVGPNPAINGFVRSDGALRVVSGVASGGSALVVRRGAGIAGPRDLSGRVLASPQIASTQDVALRAYLQKHGVRADLDGGDVTILPTSGAEIRQLFLRGAIDGAFVSEPLVSELVATADAQVLVDERDEWPGRRHPTTVLVVRKRYLDTHPELVRRFAAAFASEIQIVESDRQAALGQCLRGVERALGKALPRALAETAFDRIAFTADPMPEALARSRADAEAAGFLPAGARTEGLVLLPAGAAGFREVRP
jgi:NitT/TauT family transport system substrate-binding protein